MTSGIQTVVFPVRDLATAKSIITILSGVQPHTDEPYYVGWNVDGQEVGLNPGGHDQGMTSTVPYWKVEDIDASLEELVAAGATVQQPATAVGGGRRVASVVDADGNLFGLMQDA